MEIKKSILLKLHSGYVLDRPTQKTKCRMVKPVQLYKCEICFKVPLDENLVRTERGGNTTILTECIDCYIERVNG